MAAQHDQARRDEFYRDPHPLYARARRAEGLVFVPEADAWLVARDRDVREVLGRAEEFSSANALTADIALSQEALGVLARGFAPRPTVVASDGADHRRLRAPLNRGLSSARVSALLPYAQQCARELVDAFSGDGSAELVAAYARQLPGQVVGRLIGLDPADVPAAVHGGYRAEELLFRPLPPAEQAAAAEDVVALQHLLDGYVRARRAEPRDDLCSDLVAALAPGDDELTLEQRHELVSNLQNLLIAGFLTTSALIVTTLLHLLADREQWRLLCADPALVPAAVEEGARYDSAVQAFRRTTTRPVTLAGTKLPAGATVLVAYGAAGRDEQRYGRAEEFDIRRPEDRSHLAFGHGPHGCPGSRLGRGQLRLTLELFTRELPDLRLDEDRPPPVMRPTLIHRSPETLYVTW
ncbi:Cytochrome P450 107B1 [Streptomyces xanthophaeus]|uniref:cytochrome P450 n=1 Tax=Streptomyces xanthophaeus TaxID=67385 RepID=UPI00233F0325|nr:cytochrome P450 [Streptomyces xanthophaeus]WCD85013.1 Cytochrome P450 107B1 [Streptomyces xanthophaeus]